MQRILKVLSSFAVAVFFIEEFTGAQLRIDVISIGGDCITIDVVRIVKSFEMDQRSRYTCQFSSAVRLLLLIVSNQRFEDWMSTVLLTGEFKNFGAAQIACEFVSRSFAGVRRSMFELTDCLGVTTRRGKHFGQLMAHAGITRILDKVLF